MPRLRKPPAQAEEIDDTVLVNNEPAPTEEITIDLDDDGLGPVEVNLAPEKPVAPAAPSPTPTEDDPVKKALEATQRAEELSRNLAEAQRQRDEALARARDGQAMLERERGDREDAQYNSMLTALAAEQSVLETAKVNFQQASSAGDWAAAAEAQAAMSRATARIDRLEDGKQAFESRRVEPKPAPQPQQRPSIDEQISRLPTEAQAWLRAHPEFLTDNAKNMQAQSLHGYLVNIKRIPQYSKEYFDALDTEFGFKQAPAAPVPAPSPAPQPRRSMPVSAPVSRDPPAASGQRSSGQITLTPEQRTIARNSFGPIKDKDGKLVDLTNEQKERLYANNLAKLRRMRESGEYRQTTEQTG